ncbi:hypothetical protein ACLOJK_029709, partial [Asimina triloba]
VFKVGFGGKRGEGVLSDFEEIGSKDLRRETRGVLELGSLGDPMTPPPGIDGWCEYEQDL